MKETYVRLLCPECTNDWTAPPADLPSAGTRFQCPDCEIGRRTAEFARTDHDLQTLKQFN